MTRRILIISPHFPPVNAPDHQRVRLALPYLEEFGWQATVLAVRPQQVEGATLDPLLEQSLPRDVQVIRTNAISAAMTRRLGFGSLSLRALPYLKRAGDSLLKTAAKPAGAAVDSKIDLVFFSTTQFPVMTLGPSWKGRCDVPYVVDFQDPWLDDYYERTGTAPPGGRLRYGLGRLMARRLEPRVVREASHIVSVSPHYVETLQERYPHLRPERFTVIPFGTPERDFEMLRHLSVKQELFEPADGFQHWVYVGRGGKDMAQPLDLLFTALRAARSDCSAIWQKTRFHFVGTSYAPAALAEKTILPMAKERGVEDLVEEYTTRIPYFESLKLLQDADAVLILGSESPGYNPSKTMTVASARKPVLAILQQTSPAIDFLRACRAAEVVTFDPSQSTAESLSQTAQALQRVRGMAADCIEPDINELELAKCSDREMTRQLCNVFDQALNSLG